MYPENWTGDEDRMLCQWRIVEEVRREEMSTQRKRDSAEFKARVALDAVNGHKTVNELASLYGVHPTQITHWKHQLQQEVPQMFSARRAQREHDQEALQAQ
jgi:transposase-like protein